MKENDEDEIVRQFKNNINKEKESRIEKYQKTINDYFDQQNQSKELDDFLLGKDADHQTETPSKMDCKVSNPRTLTVTSTKP